MSDREAAPLEALLRVVEPPLRYLATAGAVRLAPNAVPTEPILRRIEEARAAGVHGGTLDRLRTVLEVVGNECPDRRERAAEGLRILGELRAASAQSRVPYRRSAGDVPSALAALLRQIPSLEGIGPRRAEMLGRQGIETLEDLLYHLPFRYEDRRVIVPIAKLEPGKAATVVGDVVAAGAVRAGRSGRRIFEAKVSDGSGVLGLTFFHQHAFFARKLEVGSRVVLFGKLEVARGRRQMVHPEVERIDTRDEEEVAERVVPVYEKPTDMTVGAMRKIVAAALREIGDDVPSVLPEEVSDRQRVLDLATALSALHQPEQEADVEALNEGRSEAHHALVFDELFYLELGLLLRRSSNAEEPGIALRPAGDLARRLRSTLPYVLTRAQERVLEDVAADMARPHPMNRLVQGDVGSGKTIVAVFAALAAVECGFQAALMAPTEILAEQHHRTITRLLAPLHLEAALLTGKIQGKARREVYERVASGRLAVLVGTQAVIQEGVRFARLGLGIVDEQHRFGVMQRKKLAGLGENPDILLLTATPIPRTLAMTLYGDLDVSFLDDLPPGRIPIRTHVVRAADRERVYGRVRAEVESGRQAYLVFPLVEESEESDLRSAKAMATELAQGPFRGLRLGLLHGQMKAEEKDAVMRRFQAGDHQILVATTVVEVGIDVPNATVMVVDHAEQFGLAQLHQLRGRVGRGAETSWCFLVSTGRAGPAGHERLKLLERERNGARIAEADLESRGPGELLGLRQSGLPGFRVANLVRDVRLLDAARREAENVLRDDPGLRHPRYRDLRAVLEHRWSGRLGLARVG